MSASLYIDTGPPGRGASAVTSRGKREKHLAGDQTSNGIIAQQGRRTQLSRICRPLVAVWRALDWRDWEELRVRAQTREAVCRQ